MRPHSALLPVLLVSILTGCAGFPASLPYTPPTYFAYHCPEGAFEVKLAEDGALVLIDGEHHALPSVPSASGAKYENAAGTMLFTKGSMALFERDGLHLADCRGEPVDTPWRGAAVRGVDLRAVGNEPGWLLELDHKRGVLVLLDYGETVLKAPPPRLKIYPLQVRTETHRIEIITEDKGCRDVMSGEYSPLTITMTINGTSYSGCGRHLKGG